MCFNSKVIVGICANPLNKTDHFYNEDVMAVTPYDREEFGSVFDGIDILCSRCRYELLTSVGAPSPPPTDDETIDDYDTESAFSDDDGGENYYPDTEMDEQEISMLFGSEEDGYDFEEEDEEMMQMEEAVQDETDDKEEEPIPSDGPQIKFIWTWSDTPNDTTNFTIDEGRDGHWGIELLLVAANYLEMKETEAAQQ